MPKRWLTQGRKGILLQIRDYQQWFAAWDRISTTDGLSIAWLQDRHLPDKALDLLDEACVRARIPTISKPADRMAGLVVTARTVAEVLGEWQGISAAILLEQYKCP